MSQSHAKRGTDSPQTQHKKRRVNKQNSLTQYGLTKVRNEAIGVSRNLHRPVPSHCANAPNFNFFLLKLSFHRLGCCSIKSSAPRKIFYPFFHPNHPCQDENPHHRRLQEDRHRRQKTDTATRRHHRRHRRRSTPPTPRRPTPPPEDIIDDTEEIDATESEKNEDTRRTITIILGMPRVFCIKHLKKKKNGPFPASFSLFSSFLDSN